MKRLRAGIVGLGVGEQHIHGYRNTGLVDVVGLCDFGESKRNYANENYPECDFYSSAEEMIDQDDLDIISIASYDHHHADQIIQALNSGKHVFCEKPLCQNEEELEAIKETLNSYPGLRLSTNTILRMSERFSDVFKRIKSGSMGDIYYIEADYNYGRLHKIMEGWRGKIKNYSVMLGGGIHMVDLLLWFASSRVTEVHALGNKKCSSGSEFITSDMVVALLKFENNIIGKVSANFGCVYPHFHKLSVYGTKASYENNLPEAKFYTSNNPDVSADKINTKYPGVAKGDLIPGFIDTILGKGKAVIEEDDIFAAMSVCLAIDRSLITGKPEFVKYLN